MALPSDATYHSRRGDFGGPKELVPSSRQRAPSEVWPSVLQTFAFGEREGHFLSSFCANATIPQLPPDEFPRTRTDHRLGPHDIMLYPQKWNPLAPHHAWIERREPHRNLHKGHIVAYVFQVHDWTPVSQGSMYGRISSDLLARLKEAFYEIHLLVLPLIARAKTHHILPTLTISECMRLLSDLDALNSTFWESARLVTRVQRGIAELLAFRLFRLDVQHHVGDEHFVSDRMFNYVGVFTTDKGMAILLHRLGVPIVGIIRGLPKAIALSSVVRAVSWRTVVETQPLDSLEMGEWNLSEQTVMSEPVRDIPAPHSSLRRSPSPTQRSDRGRSPRLASQSSRMRSRSPPRGSRHTGKSQSRASGSRRDASPERMSNYPRYMLNEQPCISDERRRQHPDAPERWRPRTWSTDPGHQTSLDFKLPDWAPQLPGWLRDIARSVDRSVTREWRLSADDTPNAVPQDIFARPLEYMLPPLHLLLKHEKRFMYVIRAWAALRDFWLRRIMDVETRGLPASTWRKILDDKYHISKELVSWIAAQATTQTHTAQPGAEDVPMEEDISHIPLETVKKRVSILSSRLRNEIAQQENQRTSVPEAVRYTRAPEPGEDLPATSSRRDAEPEEWRSGIHQVDVFCEIQPRCMVLLDEISFAAEMSGQTRWDEYWDYENSRILLFNRDSRLPDEHSGTTDREILLHSGTLSWHRSRDDQSGVCTETRAMWCASGNTLTDSSGKLVKFTAAISNSTPHRLSPGNLGERVRDAAATETVSPAARQGGPSLKSHRATPPPDPVYGYAPELPNGHEITQFVVRHCVLSPGDLARPEVRAFLIWELEEAGFRFQLRRTDTYIMKSLGVWTEEVQAHRDAIVQQCWGASNGFVPSGMGIPAHVDPDPRQRVASIYNFWKLIRSWPRVRDVSNLRRFTQHEGLTMEQLLEVEHEVWKFYAQTFYDYFGILPTLPTLMPVNPFVDAQT